MQPTNEEMQTTNEEMQTTNEEMQQTNEEMQQTNEEMQKQPDVTCAGVEDYTLKFQTTQKNCKAYEYRDHTWNCKNQLDVDAFLKETKYDFKQGGCIQKNDQKTCGYEMCVTDEFKYVGNVLYLVSVYGKILKGGSSKNPMQTRSYPAGTEDSWTMKGTCSDTNYVWSQIFRACVKNNIPVIFYIYKAPTSHVEYKTSEGKTKHVEMGAYEEMEKELNAHLNKELGRKIIGEGKLLDFTKE